jgi:hypothetical protein
VVAQPGSAGVGWETELIAGVHLIEIDEREHDQIGRCEPKRKMYFCRDAIITRARWAGEEGFGLRGKGGRWGWLCQRPSGPVRLAGRKREMNRKKDFQIQNWIFEFNKALEIRSRRFRRNLDTRIFPKFF